jgi:hypothetical protein
MVAVNTIFGSFDEADLKSVRDALDEISISITKMNSEKDAIKDIINAVYDKHKIPKKIIRKMAKAHHKQSFEEEVAEYKEFEALYVGMNETK